ncbi:MAG: CHAT domain-containing protein [Acidobacteriaceae bacterium]|nr:CHAT domain-containing protein [Acidobacteriaceae bacterium]
MKIREKVGDSTAYTKVNAARILDGRGQVAGAERLYLEVASAPSGDIAPKLRAHAGLARMYVRLAEDAKADRQYQAALHTVQESTSGLRKDENKLTTLAMENEVHGEYIDFLMARGKTEAALEVAESSRARLLQERYGDGQATRTIDASLYKRVAQNSQAVLLSYWLGPERSYVWLTTPKQILAYTLPAQERLRSLVENYRQLIEGQSNPLDEEDTTGAELYDGLLRPVADRLPKDGNVIIAPDGALNALNFETLPVPGGRPHYFIEDASVAVVPSLNLLVQSENARSGHPSGRMLLIGDPDSTDEQFPKLSYAQAEIRDISRHFDTALVSAFTNSRAVPEAYSEMRGARYSYVHFTAHASANHEVPLDSAIILSGKAGANRLTAGAVRDHKIDAEVVTISACRSAGAKTYAGEGLVGFMWAFFKAGAHNIVAGLWDVSDESTPELMDEMYARLTSGETAVHALRAAKLKVIRSNETFALPYFWGPFQLYVREIPAHRTLHTQSIASN